MSKLSWTRFIDHKDRVMLGIELEEQGEPKKLIFEIEQDYYPLVRDFIKNNG